MVTTQVWWVIIIIHGHRLICSNYGEKRRGPEPGKMSGADKFGDLIYGFKYPNLEDEENFFGTAQANEA